MRRLEWSPKALEDLEYWKRMDLKKYEKIWLLCESVCQTPAIGLGKPEQLKYELTGCWSRRIVRGHRLVYQFDDDKVYIMQARGHYEKS